MDALTMIMMVAIVLMVTFPFIVLLVNWLLKRKTTLIENPIDVHEAIVHKMKKAGRRNLRGVKARYLWCTGDNNFPGFRYSRLYGIVWAQDCVVAMVYNGRRMLSKVSMAIYPMELSGDVFSENLAVNCRGFRFKANFLIPVWPSEVFDEKTGKYREIKNVDRERWETILDNYITFLVTGEKIEQMHEENVNGIIESINTKAQATPVYQRDEHMANADPSTIRGIEDGTTSA